MEIKWKYHLARLFFYCSAGATLGYIGQGLDSPAFWAIMLCMVGSVVVTGWEATETFKKELDDFVEFLTKSVDDALKEQGIQRKEKENG